VRRGRDQALLLGTRHLLIAQRDPIQTAKQVASSTRCRRQVPVGVGNGWNEDEMANHGHRLREPPQAGARAYRGHEGDLDSIESRVSLASS